jgi:hypothetical protein
LDDRPAATADPLGEDNGDNGEETDTARVDMAHLTHYES